MEPRRISRHSAVAGTIIWIVWQLLFTSFAPVVLFVLSPLVLVPLLLAAVLDAHEDCLHARGNRPYSAFGLRAGSLRVPRADSPLLRALSWAQLPCALLLPVGLSAQPGAFALLSCLPWAGWTALAAVEGLRRVRGMLRRGGLRGLYDSELAIAAGLGFPVIGSGWLLCDRLAIEPLGFSPLIVLLTAVHFHHAGLTLPLSAGLLGRAMPEREPWRAAAVGVVVAVPLVAIGITYSPLLELVGSLLTAGAAITIGIGMLRRATILPRVPLLPALLSALAGACLLAAMMFASSYALGEYSGAPWPDINSMIQLHGAVNALGFGLLGAWAWHLSPPAVPRSADQLAARGTDK